MPLALIGFVMLGVLGLASARLSVRFAARREKLTPPNGWRYDVLVNRDGVMLYSSTEALLNLYSTKPAIVGFLRRAVRQRHRWAVTVRPFPYRGYRDLLRETFDDEPAAIERARELGDALRSGPRLWPDDAEWFR